MAFSDWLISFLLVRLRFDICGVGEHPLRRSERLCPSWWLDCGCAEPA